MNPTNTRFTPLDFFVDPDGPICYGILKPGENHPGGIPIIKVKNIIGGKILEDNLLFTSPEIHKQYKRAEVKGGDLLLTIRGTTGRVAIVPKTLTGANITQDTARIRVSSNDSPTYVYYALQSPDIQRQIELNTVGQAVKGINIGEVKKLSIYHPARTEQEGIARILSTWDLAITTTDQLITRCQQQKNALMAQLLSGTKRFSGFSEQWKKKPITNCLVASSLRNSNSQLGIDEVMSVNKSLGMIPMREQTIGKTIDRYKVVKNGWFAYNPMRINVGSICRWNGENDCLVSPDYVVFSCDENVILTSYFDQFRKSERWADYMNRAGNGSVRVRIYFNDLSKLEISLPPVNEQHKIASILDAADCEIETLQQKLTCLKQEKKSLMQQLLTGKRRVKEVAAL
ncbi:restriction endonuclease subunit S [Pseudomonas sp. G5(2012)]|uniref:restriction endonuclease subunit S n=1 Tax=Pseudomonas sp. G5(2012) TaxID=1268068 RepID=UPI000343119F|nr:restriction endonuclease subunit S [Pseudomonas sp. G5(2012)]EPA98759.1 hypothetical protein PG5_08490 [Pseudomonas sp. G5(2012)]